MLDYNVEARTASIGNANTRHLSFGSFARTVSGCVLNSF